MSSLPLDDPENPQNWSEIKKASVAIQIWYVETTSVRVNSPVN